MNFLSLVGRSLSHQSETELLYESLVRIFRPLGAQGGNASRSAIGIPRTLLADSRIVPLAPTEGSELVLQPKQKRKPLFLPS